MTPCSPPPPPLPPPPLALTPSPLSPTFHSSPLPAGYPTEDIAAPTKRKFTPGKAKLRKSLVPGAVVILLQGRFAGRRAVFLKQLPSGLLLVNGPHAVNKLPLRRVDQSSVIATSTVVALPAALDLSKCTDEFFSAKAARTARSAAVSKAENFFAEQQKTASVSAERKAVQSSVDSVLSKVLTAEQSLYLKSRFKLSQGDKPHEMKF